MIFQDQKFYEKYAAIELFLNLQRELYGGSKDPVKTEYALIEMLDKSAFTGVFVGGSISICLVPCDNCVPVLYN